MIEGNIHLSSDLRRLAFLRIFVWLSHYRTRMGEGVLVNRYRDIIQNKREQQKWNVDPETGTIVSGRGMGRSDKINDKNRRTRKHRSTSDFIANNHLTLARNLEIIKKGETTWSKNGYVLASLALDEDGVPFFFDKIKLDSALNKRGFLTRLSEGEKLLYSLSLFSVDFDRLLPFIDVIGEYSVRNDIDNNYFNYILKWLENKRDLESNRAKKYKMFTDIKDMKDKISRLEVELKADKTNVNVRRKKPSIKTYCREQTSPRIEFLKDLDLVKKEKSKYYLTELGIKIRDSLIIPIYNSESIETIDVPIEKILSFEDYIIKIMSEDYPQLDFDLFKVMFNQVGKFYSRSGAMLLSYDNIFKAISVNAFEKGKLLSLNSFQVYLEYLSNRKEVLVSTSGRGTKYIRLRRSAVKS